MDLRHIIGPAAGVALLSSCAMPSPSVAAKVGGTEISESTVTVVAEGCAPIAKATANALRTDVVTFLIRGEIARAIAAQEDIAIKPGEVEALVKQTQMAPFAADPECAKITQAFGALNIVIGRIGEPKFLTRAGEVALDVNPRYGTWSPTKFELAGSGSISDVAKQR